MCEAGVVIRCGHPQGVCMKVATGVGMTESVSFCPKGSSVPAVEGEPPGPPMVALSQTYYTKRQGWILWRNFTAAIPGPLEMLVYGHGNISGRFNGISQKVG